MPFSSSRSGPLDASSPRRSTILFAFHGTRKHNVESILGSGFKVAKVGSTTDAGYYGAGIYFSEQMAMSQGYNSGNDGMFLCKLLVGKPFHSPQQHGRGLEPGYTSHVADPSGSEVIIFDNDAMLPCYVVRMHTYAGHAAAYAHAAKAPKEALKGLGGSGQARHHHAGYG